MEELNAGAAQPEDGAPNPQHRRFASPTALAHLLIAAWLTASRAAWPVAVAAGGPAVGVLGGHAAHCLPAQS